jgi:hypothetical protein
MIETEPECVKVLNLDGTVRTMNAAGLAMVEAKHRQGQASRITGCGRRQGHAEPAL